MRYAKRDVEVTTWMLSSAEAWPSHLCQATTRNRRNGLEQNLRCKALADHREDEHEWVPIKGRLSDPQFRC